MVLHPIPTLKETPSQTAGPYVHIGLTPNFAGLEGLYADPGTVMVTPDTKGERIEIVVRIIDGTGLPVGDALVELWQADADGVYATGAGPFSGWGRQACDGEGQVVFQTIKPGRVAAPDGTAMAPHVSLWIVARGINMGLQTRLYFDDEAQANDGDFVLNKILDKRRRQTLIARRQGGEVTRYRLDIHLQGDEETVFFDI